MSVLLSTGHKNRKKSKSIVDSTVGGGESITSYTPSDTINVWNCIIDGHALSIALDKHTKQLWCNDSLLNTQDENSKGSIIKKFGLYNHVAEIIIKLKTSSGFSLFSKHSSHSQQQHSPDNYTDLTSITLKIDNKVVPSVSSTSSKRH